MLGVGSEQASAAPVAQSSTQGTTSLEKQFDYAFEGSGLEAAFAQEAYAPADSPHLAHDVSSLSLQAVREPEEGKAGEVSEHISMASSQGHDADHSGQGISAHTARQQTVSALGAIAAGALERENAPEAAPCHANDALAAAVQTQAGIGSNSAPEEPAEPTPVAQVVSSRVPALQARSTSPETYILALSPRNRSSSHFKLSGLQPVPSLGSVSEFSAIDADSRAASHGPNPVDLPFLSPRKLGPAVSVAGAMGDSAGTFGDSGPSLFHQAYNVEFAGVISSTCAIPYLVPALF
jgi:hypothetical protein